MIVVHHAGKNGSQRGTSSKEDVLDTVIALKKPGDYQPEQGARLEVHLEKARGIFGKEAIPFELALNMEAGRASWTCGTINKEELAERALELKNQGRSYREIAEELGINKNKVSRLLKRDQQ